MVIKNAILCQTGKITNIPSHASAQLNKINFYLYNSLFYYTLNTKILLSIYFLTIAKLQQYNYHNVGQKHTKNMEKFWHQHTKARSYEQKKITIFDKILELIII